MELKLDGVSNLTTGAGLASRPLVRLGRMRYEVITVPGRDGELTREEGYEPTTIEVEFNWLEANQSNNAQATRRKLSAWMQGKRKLEMSDDPGFYYLITRIENGALTNDLKPYGRISYTFHCEPYQYQDQPAQTLSAAGTVSNPAPYAVQPVITINGNGTGNVIINGVTSTAKNLVGSVVWDGIHQEAHKNGVTQNHNKVGPYPTLKPGNNSVSFTGGITSLKIEKRWAWR